MRAAKERPDAAVFAGGPDADPEDIQGPDGPWFDGVLVELFAFKGELAGPVSALRKDLGTILAGYRSDIILGSGKRTIDC